MCIACIPDDGLGVTLEVSMDVRGEHVIRVAPEIRRDNGRDRPGRNLVDDIIFAFGAHVDLTRRPHKGFVEQV